MKKGTHNQIRKSILFLLTVVLLISCIPARYSETRFSITGESSIPVTLIIYSERKPDWDKLFQFLESKARLYDYRVQESPVQQLNARGRAHLPDDVYQTLITALDIAEKSGGAFDPTILPLTQLWNFDSIPSLPKPGDILTAVKRINYRKVTLPGDSIVQLPQDYGIDLGGIAKGALVDSLAGYLHSMGNDNFLIEAGGDILISGLKPGNKQWVIGIRHPVKKDELAGELSLGEINTSRAVVTSGDYEKYFEQDGIRYHHLLDPSTGYPAREVVSVTVIAPTCAEADALATAAFILGKKEGRMFLENENDTEGLFLYKEESGIKTVMTEGFSRFFRQEYSPD
jgi:FAD:protein FMN transferase